MARVSVSCLCIMIRLARGTLWECWTGIMVMLRWHQGRMIMIKGETLWFNAGTFHSSPKFFTMEVILLISMVFWLLL